MATSTSEKLMTNTVNTYLSFRLGEEIFAANVQKVLNILELTHITKVPKSPEYMRGVINLRGSVLPVIDLRIKFGIQFGHDIHFTRTTQNASHADLQPASVQKAFFASPGFELRQSTRLCLLLAHYRHRHAQPVDSCRR